MMKDCAFEEWLQKIVMIIDLKSIIVMDNVPYLSIKVEKIPVVLSKSCK